MTPISNPPSSPTPPTPPHDQHHDLLIIGAGIHGLALLHTYLTAHHCLFPASQPPRVVLLDSTPQPHIVGGVWSSSRLYPGLKTNNLLGSYEFSDYPLDSVKYGVRAGEHIPGEVVGAYLRDFVEEKGMGAWVRGGLRVVSVEGLGGLAKKGDEGWKVVARRVGRDGGESRKEGEDEERGKEGVFYTSCLAVCTGSTSLPNMPRFMGQEGFGRLVVHSADLPTAIPKLLSARDHSRGSNGGEGSVVDSEDGRLGTRNGTRHFVVIGGNKSAFDAAYALAMGLYSTSSSNNASSTSSALTEPADTRVTILLRPSGGGPSWVWPRFITPFKLSVQRLATTRIFTLLDPTPWTRYRWVRWLLHYTLVGRWVIGIWWWIIAWFILAGRGDGAEGNGDIAGIDSQERRRRANMFKPWTGLEWVGNSLSVDNYDEDFWGLVRKGRIKAVIAEVKELRLEGRVLLSDGSELEDVQGIVCCTGWKTKPSFRWLPEGIEDDLGLPGSRQRADRKKKQSVIDEEVAKQNERQCIGKELLAEIPTLRQRPRRRLPAHGAVSAQPVATPEPSTPPWQLYRNLIAIPSSNNPQHGKIAFLGTQLSVATTLVAQAQALWATAYFLDHPMQDLANINKSSHNPPLLPLPSPATMRRTMLKDVEYQRLRHPAEAGGAGERCADLVFDSLGYVDVLLEDLGLESRRKVAARRREKVNASTGAGGESLVSRVWQAAIVQWEELTQRYWPADYRGMVEEWAGLVKLRRSSDVHQNGMLEGARSR